MKTSLSNISIFFSSTFLLAGLVVGNLVSMYFKSANPEDRDITQGLAYLGYILIPTFLVVTVGWVCALVTLVSARKQEGAAAAFATKLFIVMTLLTLVLAVTDKINSKIVDNYRETHTTQQQ